MAKQQLPVSKSLAALLRDRREQLNLTLREVEDRSRQFGDPIPFTTLGKVERGVVDLGFPRLNSLCKVYGISLQTAGDVLDLEHREPIEQRPVAVLEEEAAESWKRGDIRNAMAVLASIRTRTDLPAVERQQSLLHFAIVAGSLGRYQVSQSVIDDLLLEPPLPELLVRVLVQAAVCWHRRGCGEAALGFLSRAEHHLQPGDSAELAYVMHERASTLTSMGQLDEAEIAIEKALAAYRQAGKVHGESGALGVGIRIAACRQDHALAVERAQFALDHARSHHLQRLCCLRLIDKAKALIQLQRFADTWECLHEALVVAISEHDHAAQFYVYHARWRARLAEGDEEKALLELSAAQYAMRYVDAAGPEAWEIRSTLPGSTDLSTMEPQPS